VRLNGRLRNVLTYLFTYLFVVFKPVLFSGLLQETSAIGNVVILYRVGFNFNFISFGILYTLS